MLTEQTANFVGECFLWRTVASQTCDSMLQENNIPTMSELARPKQCHSSSYLKHLLRLIYDTEMVTNKLNLTQKVNMDELYDECITSNTTLKGLREGAGDEWKSKDVAARWVALFQVADLPNILTIINHILSIPASTGYVERIFPRMANKWRDKRNRCSVELMRSELLITLNFEQS
eukprot:superscaffoldBa00000486_g5105